MLRQALTLNPNLRYVYTRLGQLYRERGDEAAAQKEFREAIRLIERETGSQPNRARSGVLLKGFTAVWATTIRLPNRNAGL